MQGNPKVVEFLNEALTLELTAINQYYISYKMAENWALPGLAKLYYDDSMSEMKHADTLIERVLFLDGTPNMQRLSNVQVGEDPVEQFRLNHQFEIGAVERYRRGIAICAEEGDPGTRALLEQFLAEEEHHVDEGEAQLDLLERLGEQLWLQRWA